MHLTDFEFDSTLIDLSVYEQAIKDVLTHYVVLDHYYLCSAPISVQPLLSQAKMAEDADNILMALKALEGSTAASSQPLCKFVYQTTPDGRTFRIHLPRRRPGILDSRPRQCVGFFGERPRLHLLDPRQDHLWYARCFSIDESIVDAVDPSVVSAYVTGQVQPGINSNF